MRKPTGKTASEVEAIMRRRARVAELLLQKQSVSEIARTVRASPKTVYDDIACIREAWRESAIGDLAPRIGEQLATIENLKKQLHELLRIETRTDVVLRVVDRLLSVMDRESKLLGLNAPDELRLDASTLTEVIALVLRTVIPFVTNPEDRVRLADEIAAIRERYAAGQWQQQGHASGSSVG